MKKCQADIGGVCVYIPFSFSLPLPSSYIRRIRSRGNSGKLRNNEGRLKEKKKGKYVQGILFYYFLRGLNG